MLIGLVGFGSNNPICPAAAVGISSLLTPAKGIFNLKLGSWAFHAMRGG